MYTPLSTEVDEAEAHRLLGILESGNLVTATDAGIMATLLPWVLDPSVGDYGALTSHVARKNPQWETPWHGEALVIAELPQGYISASYYPGHSTHGKVVPTWNYVAVHAYGDLVIHDDREWLASAVRMLSDRFESGRDEPWLTDEAPAQYIDAMLNGIVGVELRITRVEAKVKMSRNRDAAERATITAALEADGRADLAEWMRAAVPLHDM